MRPRYLSLPTKTLALSAEFVTMVLRLWECETIMSNDNLDAAGNSTESTVDAAAVAEAVARLEHMFADCADDPRMQELRRLALARAEQGVIH